MATRYICWIAAVFHFPVAFPRWVRRKAGRGCVCGWLGCRDGCNRLQQRKTAPSAGAAASFYPADFFNNKTRFAFYSGNDGSSDKWTMTPGNCGTQRTQTTRPTKERPVLLAGCSIRAWRRGQVCLLFPVFHHRPNVLNGISESWQFSLKPLYKK